MVEQEWFIEKGGERLVHTKCMVISTEQDGPCCFAPVSTAPLIVRAVNAHAALIQACEMAEIWFRGSVLSAQEQAVVATLRAALAKARGEE